MPNEIGGALRGARTTTSIEGQDDRVGTMAQGSVDRAAHVGRGTLINYYDDLGISTSEGNANQIRTEEKTFNDTVSQQQAAINRYKNDLEKGYENAKGSISSAQSEFPSTYSEAIKNSWEETQKGFMKVNVYTNNKFESSYLLPKEAVLELQKTSFNGQEGHYASLMTKEGLNVDTRPVGISSPYGKELHESLQQGVTDTYNQWYTKSAPIIQENFDKGYEAFKSAYNSLSSQYATGNDNYQTAQTDLDKATLQRAGEWDTIRTGQKNRTENMKGVLSNLNIESVE